VDTVAAAQPVALAVAAAASMAEAVVVASTVAVVVDAGKTGLTRKIEFPQCHNKSPLASASGLFVCGDKLAVRIGLINRRSLQPAPTSFK
jgi:hypothetical protein